jgi:hypothetical protein
MPLAALDPGGIIAPTASVCCKGVLVRIVMPSGAGVRYPDLLDNNTPSDARMSADSSHTADWLYANL